MCSIRILHILNKTVIDSFVSSANKNNMIVFRKKMCMFLRKDITARCWHNNCPATIYGRYDAFNSINHWLCFDKHTIPTTIDSIINLLMFVYTKCPGIYYRKSKKSLILCFSNKRCRQKRSKNIWEKRNKRDMHSNNYHKELF